MQARDFLDEIDLALNVETPGRNTDGEFRLRARFGYQFKSKPLQNRENLVGWERRSENAVHLRNAEHYRSLVHLASDGVDLAAVEFASARFHDPLCHQRARQRRCAVVRSTLEAVRGVGVQA